MRGRVTAIEPMPHRLRRDQTVRSLELTVLVLPAVIVVLLFNYLPLYGLTIAFRNYRPMDGITGSAWVGLENFAFVFGSRQFLRAIYHTIGYNLVFITLETVIPIFLAVLLYEVRSKKLVKLYQTVMFMPFYLSWVVVSIILYAFLSYRSGAVNTILTAAGVEPVRWYTSPQYWPIILPLLYVWKRAGYATVIYYAGLVGIDPQLYESADMDGATKLQKTFNITIPGILPIASILIILALGRVMFADFGLFYQSTLQSGPLIETADVISWYTFRALTELRDYSLGAAAGLFQGLVGILMILFANWLSRRLTGGDHGLF